MSYGAIYTYYYGILCAECGRFNVVNSYETQLELGAHPFVDSSITVRCLYCSCTCTYLAEKIVVSRKPDEYVPLIPPGK